MPLSTATVTFDVSDLLGVDFDPKGTKVWVTTNVENDTLIDTGANKIRLGSGSVALNADGTGSVSVWVPGADANPASWQTFIHFEYFDPHGSNYRRAKSTRSFGPFTITANADLADLVAEQEVPAEYLDSVTTALGEFVDSAQVAATTSAASATSAAASAATATEIALGDGDALLASVVNDPTSDTRAALSANLIPRGTVAATPTVVPFLEVANSGSKSSLHVTASTGFTGPYLIGVGNDTGTSTGIVVANKAAGKGASIHQQATISSTTAYGLDILQESNAPALHGVQNTGTAPLVQFQSAGDTTATQQMIDIIAGVGKAGFVFSLSGVLAWQRDIVVGRTTAGAKVEVRGNLHESSEDVNRAWQRSDAFQLMTYAGSTGNFFAKRLFGTSNQAQLQVSNGTITIGGTPTWVTGLTVGVGGGNAAIGFLGTSPIQKRATTPDATDLATAITLVNALKADLVAYGLKA